MNRLLAVAVLAPVFAGCDPLLPVVGESSSYGPAGPLCSAIQTDLQGDLAHDVVGTWQDWAGRSDNVIKINSDGTLTVSASKLNPDTQAQEISVIASGKFSANNGVLTVNWDDAKVEANRAVVEETPGCEMLVMQVPDGNASRLSSAGELERVACTDTTPPPEVVTSKTNQ